MSQRLSLILVSRRGLVSLDLPASCTVARNCRKEGLSTQESLKHFLKEELK